MSLLSSSSSSSSVQGSSESSTPPRCPACASIAFSSDRRVADHEYEMDTLVRYIRCDSCGSEAQMPMPDPATLASFYPNDYHSFTGESWLQLIRNDLRIRRLSRFLGEEGAILDYGCGSGSFLRRLADRMPDRKLFGFEIAAEPEILSLANGRITIVKGDYTDLLPVLPQCRLMTLNHVIEHLPAPLEVIRALCEKLLPGGVLEGQTPAARSTEQRVFGGYWSGYHAPRHTVVFSRQGLETLFDRANFSSVELSSAFNPAGLAVSLASWVHGRNRGRVEREGLRWLGYLALATAMAPFDLLLGSPAVVDFAAQRSS